MPICTPGSTTRICPWTRPPSSCSSAWFPREHPEFQNGDEIELDVANRRLTLRVADDELARRRAAWTHRPPHFTRGYGKLFLDHVLQGHEGVDFDFLKGKTPVRSEDTAGPSHS